MKRLLCLCLCTGLVFGASGCGNAAEPTEQTAQQTQEEEQKEETTGQETEESSELPSFTFSVDDFVNMMDTALSESGKNLLTENEVVDEETQKTFKISEYATLSLTKNPNGNLGTILFDVDLRIDSNTLMYVDALMIPAIFICEACDADMLTQIAEELDLASLDKGNRISLGKNGTYTFDITDEKMQLLIFPN